MAATKTKTTLLQVDDSDKAKKVKFVVKAGQTFGIEKHRAGTVVELTVREALAFADLLEPEDRKTALPTAQALVEAGVQRVANPSGLTTDRQDMTPKQRAETSTIGESAGKASSLPDSASEKDKDK